MPKETLSREKLVEEISGALAYRSSYHRVGAMAFVKVVHILNGTYGMDKMPDLLENADMSELQRVHIFLDSCGYIGAAIKRAAEIKAGARFCPHCGGRL